MIAYINLRQNVINLVLKRYRLIDLGLLCAIAHTLARLAISLAMPQPRSSGWLPFGQLPSWHRSIRSPPVWAVARSNDERRKIPKCQRQMGIEMIV